MDKLKIQITYEGKTYTFDDGLKVYIFHLGLQYAKYEFFEFGDLMQFVDKVYEVANIPASTWVEDVAKHIANYWEKLCDLDADDVFEDFVENKEDF